MTSWKDPKNAEIYDAFTRKHPMYRDTSNDLVELAGMDPSDTVVDLACGTGVTTEAILERLDDAGRVIALDASEAMLRVAQARLSDTRVRWVNADGSEVAANAAEAGAIICNSAIWQTDMEPTIVACGKALRPGRKFGFQHRQEFSDDATHARRASTNQAHTVSLNSGRRGSRLWVCTSPPCYVTETPKEQRASYA